MSVVLSAAQAWVLGPAEAGLSQGSGPFWDATQLCGRPLFGAWGLPWSGPLSLVLLQLKAWPLAFSALFGMLMLAPEEQRWSGRVIALALLGLLPFLFMPLGFQSGLALAPWALLAFWQAPFFAAVALLALLATTLSPLLYLAAIGLAWSKDKRFKPWAMRVAWSLALSVPAWAPLLAHNSVALELGKAWPIAPPSEWVAGAAWACLSSVVLSAKGLKPGVLAALLCFAAAFFLAPPPPLPARPAAASYNEAHTRFLDAKGTLLSLQEGAAALSDRATTAGSADGRGSLFGLRRWQRLAFLGVREPDLLSLANVGWLAADKPEGLRWNRPAGAALVESAVSEDEDRSAWVGKALFERPLMVSRSGVKPSTFTSWTILTPGGNAGGPQTLTLPSGNHGGWAFLSQSYDPGWQAQIVDAQGKRQAVAVVRTEGDFLAVPVESGALTVTFEYRPPLFGLGLWVCGLALMVLAWKERAFLFQAH